MGFDLPTEQVISNLFLGWEAWKKRDTGLEPIVAQMWSGYIENEETLDLILEECKAWHSKILQMPDENRVKREYGQASALVGLGLGPMEIQLEGRMEVRRLMMQASYHYADDSTKEWWKADSDKIEANKIMVKNRWSATNIMKIHAWVNPIYPVEDSLNGVIKLLYQSIDIIKEVVKAQREQMDG